MNMLLVNGELDQKNTAQFSSLTDIKAIKVLCEQ